MKHNTLVFLFRWSLSLCKRFILSCFFFILCAAPYSIVKSMKRTGILKRYECDLFTIKFIHMIAISFFLMFCLRPKSRAYMHAFIRYTRCRKQIDPPVSILFWCWRRTIMNQNIIWWCCLYSVDVVMASHIFQFCAGFFFNEN